MRSVLIWSLAVLAPTVRADCTSSPLLNTALKIFGVDSIDDLPGAILNDVQTACANGNCPNVTLPGCASESVDDLLCEVPVFDTTVKLGTDVICDVACLPLFLIPHCKEKCEKELSLEITGDFERLTHLVSSLVINQFDLDCQGNGLTSPLAFNASTVVGIQDLGLRLKIHTSDLGIGTTTTIDLSQLKVIVSLPLSGSVQCGLLKRQKNITIEVGKAHVDSFDLNLDVNNNAIHDVSKIVCLGLPFCEHTIQGAIDDAITLVINTFAPGVLGRIITPVGQAVMDGLECPGSIETEALV